MKITLNDRAVRYRPKFKNWSGSVWLLIDVDAVDLSMIEKNLNGAGKVCGVGDFRPDKGGMFGQYKAKLV